MSQPAIAGQAATDRRAPQARRIALIESATGTIIGTVTDQQGAYRRGHRLGNHVLTGLVATIFGRGNSDMLSGYRVFSRRFVKTFPAIATGFEIETELTVHALEMRLPAAEFRTVLSSLLPRRLAERLCEVWLASKPMRQFRDAELKDIAAQLQDWPLVASGTEGYRTAEVTLGGVDTDEVSSATLMSKRQQGLYFVGEVLDVTGHLGGYNFQWAWASGHAAGQAL